MADDTDEETLPKKPAIVLDAATSRSLVRLRNGTAAGQTTRIRKDASVAAMLSQLQSVAGMLLQELGETDAPMAKRLSMAKDMAKLIPLLATAERKVRKGWKGKEVEDMTDAELRQAHKALKVVKTR